MSVKIVDLSPRHYPCYSNEVHHANLQDTLARATTRSTIKYAAEIVDQFYLDSFADRFTVATPSPALQQQAGTRLLQLVKQRITRKMRHAA